MRMFSLWHQNQQWTPVREWSAKSRNASPEAAVVLTLTGSLTRFLQRAFGMALTLNVHEQVLDRCHPAEAKLLDCKAGDRCLRRRVSLLHRRTVMFDAESVLPLEWLPTNMMSDLQDGKKPLGNLLLDWGLSLSRSDLSIAHIQLSDHSDCRWARRSVLRAPDGPRALIVECFHPVIWTRLQDMKKRR